MKVTLRALVQKTTLMATAFILAVSTLTAAMPFILSEKVGAVAPIGNSSSGTVSVTASYASLFSNGFDVGITVANMESDPAIDRLSFKFYDADGNYLTSVTAKQRLFNLENQPGTADDGTYGVRKADGQWNVSRHIFMNDPVNMVSNGWWQLDTFYEWTAATAPARVDIDFATGNGTFTRTISPLSVTSGGSYANVVANNPVPAVKPSPKISGQYLTLFNGYIDVGFTASMLEVPAAEAKVDIYKDTTLLTTLKFTQAQLDRFENGRAYSSSRALYIPGPQGDTSMWDVDNSFVWTADTQPTKAIFTVAAQNGTTTAQANFTVQEAQAWNYQNIIAALPAITAVDAYYQVGSGFTSIQTDFTVKNITDATGVELRVHRADSSTYSITAKQGVVDAVNTGLTQTITGPIVIAGSRSSTSWNSQTGTWVGSSEPVAVEVIITRTGGAALTLTDTIISSTLATWAQVKPVDMVAPSVTVGLNDKVINLRDILTNAAPKVMITATDAQSGVDYVQYKIMDATGVTVRGWKTVANGVETPVVDALSLANGTYTLRARAFDFDGNKSSGNDVAFVVDKNAPGASIEVSSPAGTGTLHRNTVTVTGVAVDDNIKSHWFEITNPDNTLAYSHNLSTTDLEYSFTLDTSKGDGVYKLRYVATDRAGNRNDHVVAAILTITVDNTAPNAPIVLTASDSSANGTAEPNSNVRIIVDGVSYDVVADASGNWTVTYLAVLASGSYVVEATSTDEAGNVSVVANYPIEVRAVQTPDNSEVTDEDDDNQVVEQNQEATFPPAFNPGTPDVQGDSDSNADVEGDSTVQTPAQAVNSDANQGKLFGLAWYWWLLIIAAAATAAWWIIAAVRRRNADA